MFEAIRSKLVGAWRELRKRGLVTLFFFELLVVTLGVILAQAVAEWASRRDEMEAMEDARTRANLEMGDAAKVGEIWRDIRPCLVEEIDTIMRKTSSGERIDPRLLERPKMMVSTVMPLSEQNKLLIRERYGDDAAYNYDRMQRMTARLDGRVEEVTDLWGRFALVNPAMGEASDADRHAVRETAATIKANLDSIDGITVRIIGMGKRMGLAPKILGESGQIASNCEEFESFGRDFINTKG